MRFFIWLGGAVAALAALSVLAADVLPGLDNPTDAQWRDWYAEMLRTRAEAVQAAGIDSAVYDDPASAWSDRAFRHHLLFMYDSAFFADGKYRTGALIDELTRRFGKVDSVLLWQAYPRLGFDTRTQFDFYADLPGGLAALRREVTDVLHARGIRVFVDFNPWDPGAEIPRVVEALDADGVMLDTLDSVPRELMAEVAAKKAGVVFAPERRPSDGELGASRQSWAQWYDLGPAGQPSVYREKWLVPRHLQLAIRRWDTDRHGDIVYSFFNGSGQIVWENIYGSWNPYSAADRRLLAETGAVLGAYADVLTKGEWKPLVPTGVSGLDANRWDLTENGRTRTLWTFRNRTDRTLYFALPAAPAPAGRGYFPFWPSAGAPAGRIAIPPRGTQALALDELAAGARARQAFLDASAQAALPFPEERTPAPWPVSADEHGDFRHAIPVAAPPAGYAAIPGGSYTMTVIHLKRECGCYPLGADAGASWGWYFGDTVTHRIPVSLARFALKSTAVTNEEFLRFVQESGYRPKRPENFLKQLARGPGGALPARAPAALAALPVTYVSLSDARAYARWKGERLPSEAEWQWAAEGAGQGNAWPWGPDESLANDPRYVNLSGQLGPADGAAAGVTPQGVRGLSGNAWELTESEWTDGHTRFAMLRGGVYLPPAASEWIVPRGPRPNSFHAKYLLLDDALDRSEAVSFRTVAELR